MRLGQKCFSLSETRTNLPSKKQICSGLLFISIHLILAVSSG